MAAFKLISIEVTNRCGKGCWFCYNGSGPGGNEAWRAEDLIGFIRDCAAHGVESVSLGGGEPLEYEGLEEVLGATRGVLHRSMTTNGIGLDGARAAALARLGLEKAHVSIHFAERREEVERAIEGVRRLEAAGIRAGVNLLVGKRRLEAASGAAATLHAAGIGNDRIIYLPMRMRGDEPAPAEVAHVAAGAFQSTSCLRQCGRSERFVSINSRMEAAWCSYTETRRRLEELSYGGLCAAMEGLGLRRCGG